MNNINKSSIQNKNIIKLSSLIFIFIFIYIPFSNDLVGVISLLLVIFVTLLVTKIYPKISIILLIGLALRVFTIFLGTIFNLPDSGKDALFFESLGFKWSETGFLNVIENYYPGANSKFISWVFAIIYSLFGRSLLMLQSLSLFFGMASIFIGWLLAKKIWDNDNKANKVGWFLALFPSLILYSVLTMREVYISFFF